MKESVIMASIPTICTARQKSRIDKAPYVSSSCLAFLTMKDPNIPVPMHVNGAACCSLSEMGGYSSFALL